ncbi:MAG: hypothetical protein ACRDF5_08590 [bacterium]
MDTARRPSVRRGRPEDARAVARLHREIISWGLLPSLGEGVVTAFYRAVSASPVAFCFVADDGERLWGFAAGTADWPRLRREVMRTTWRPLLRAVPVLLRGGRWRRLRETDRYTQSSHLAVSAEFLSFGVLPEMSGRVWVGAALAYAVVNEFRRRGVRRVRGVVWEQNERALKFFEAVGFRFVSEVEIHPGERSRTFVADLTPTAQGE